jgi:hypothetical protein
MFILSEIRGSHFDVVEKGLIAVMYSVIFPGVYLMSTYDIFPRSKYMESDKRERPSFKNVCAAMMKIPQNFDFNILRNEIADKYVITFEDDNEKILKFRTKSTIFSNPIATWMKFDINSGKLYLDSFSMIGTQHKAARKMQQDIYDFLSSVNKK